MALSKKSRSDDTMVAVGFSPRIGPRSAPRRGATPDSGGIPNAHASLRDAHPLISLFRGLKPTATFAASLCEAKSAVASQAIPVTLTTN